MESKCGWCDGIGFQGNYRCEYCGRKNQNSGWTPFQSDKNEQHCAETKWGAEFRPSIQQTPLNN